MWELIKGPQFNFLLIRLAMTFRSGDRKIFKGLYIRILDVLFICGDAV